MRLCAGADINLHTASDYTLLMMATVFNDINTVKYLLEHGADVSVRNSEGQTALSLAAKNSYTEKMTLIMEYGGVFSALQVFYQAVYNLPYISRLYSRCLSLFRQRFKAYLYQQAVDFHYSRPLCSSHALTMSRILPQSVNTSSDKKTRADFPVFRLLRKHFLFFRCPVLSRYLKSPA